MTCRQCGGRLTEREARLFGEQCQHCRAVEASIVHQVKAPRDLAGEVCVASMVVAGSVLGLALVVALALVAAWLVGGCPEVSW